MPQGKRGRLSYTIKAPRSAARVEVLLTGRGTFKVKALGAQATLDKFDPKKGQNFPMHPDGTAETWSKVKQLAGWS